MNSAQGIPFAVKLPAAGRASSLTELGLTWKLLGVDALGFGAAAWLAVVPATPGVRVVGRAGAPSALRIGETGRVPEIEVENLGGDPALLPAHVVLAGGWQTRTIERSVIVAPGVTARVPVKCIEAGRWAPRDERTAGSFDVVERTGMRTRWSTSRSMAEQLSFTGRFAAEQDAVWRHVDEELAHSPVTSHTRSYEAYLRGVQGAFLAAAQGAGVKPSAGANALAIVPRGGGFWLEAYPSEGALAESADALLADLFDPRHDGPSRGLEIAALVEELWEASVHPVDPPACTLGESYAFTGGSAVGAALLIDGAVAHIAGGSPPREPPDRSWEGPMFAVADSSGLRFSEKKRAPVTASAPGNSVTTHPQVDVETMHRIFARARDFDPRGPITRERVEGFRLVRAVDRNTAWVDVRIHGDGYAVLGSHDRCDLVLGGDAGVWLRHLAAICVRLADGSVGLRLIDLKTDLPFFLEDDAPRWSVLATGPFAMRLGRHVVCGFPIGSADAGPSRSSHEHRPFEPVPEVRLRRGEATATTAIETMALPASVDGAPVVELPRQIAAFTPSAPVSQIHDLLASSASAEHVRVILERGGMGASVDLPLDALDNGILLGRALNCFDGGLRRIFCESVSRAHVLLLRDHEAVFAYDLCTTNGTRVGGQRIRRHRLADSGASLELGKKVVMRWRR